MFIWGAIMCGGLRRYISVTGNNQSLDSFYMPKDDIVPTVPDYDKEHGRIALWLDPDALRWLARQLVKIEPGSPEGREQIGRIRFRITAALHKAGFPTNLWAED